MFCVVYRFHVKSGKEAQFREGWRLVTRKLREENNSLGSRLHKDENGVFIAYAQWPDRNTWDSAENHSDEAERGRSMMRDSYADGWQSAEVLHQLEMVDDLLL